MRPLILILGDQLFDPECLARFADAPVFMAEDQGLCTDVRHHQQRITLFLSAMREHADALSDAGWTVDYHRLDQDGQRPYREKLADALRSGGHDALVHVEIEDRAADNMVAQVADELELERIVIQSPGFLAPRSDFQAFTEDGRPVRMASFYRHQRKRLGILLEDDGAPRGGRWSFDQQNRRKLPADLDPPALPPAAATDHVRSVIDMVRQRFADHPGDARQFAWPVTRDQALAWLDDFLDHRLARFGPYQDAITQRHSTLFHSVLSPAINLGLLTPKQVLERALDHARDHEIPLASLEGFVRQLIGWREFVRGVYHHLGPTQEQANSWHHEREPSQHWTTGETGIPPLDDAINQARDMGWTHHIQRLMVIANLMNLAGIAPRAVHRWFMEMHVDAADWVMGPNVYGMGLASDGGLMVTKPYVCGSNYLLKMSDYSRGSWCDTVDGLYWAFIKRHRAFFDGNPRLAMMARGLDRLSAERSSRIFGAAGAFIRRINP